MVHRCCISSCGMNVRVAEAKGLSYHTFPLKEPQRDKWIAAVVPYIDKPSTFKVVQGYTRICSRHFSKKDYSIDSKKRARLSPSAVPSIFPEKGSPLIIENVLENVRTESESDILPLSHDDFEESLLSSLRLNDDLNPLSTFDNQSLEEDSFTDTKLAYDLSSSFLDSGNISSSLLEMNTMHLHELDNALQTFAFDFNSEDILISEFQNMSANSDCTTGTELTPLTPVKLPVVPVGEFQIKLELENTTTSIENETKPDAFIGEVEDIKFQISKIIDDGRRSPVANRNKRRKIIGGFSVERFYNSNKDIEYYTGFPSFRNFETFFQIVQGFAVNKKSNMPSGTCLESASTFPLQKIEPPILDTQVQPLNGPEFTTHEDDILEHTKSQTTCLLLIDELFLTMIRLKRKLPEKVLGHMFNVSQPVISRTIRAWTTLLSKLLNASSTENNQDSNKSTGLDIDESNSASNNIEIPSSFRQLLSSDLAKTILSGGSTSMSRKTTSTTSCHSTSRSKRPKKEKTSLLVCEDVTSDVSAIEVSSTSSIGIETPLSAILATSILKVIDGNKSSEIIVPESNTNTGCPSADADLYSKTAIESQAPLSLIKQELV